MPQGIYTNPTVFPFASGGIFSRLGLMAEAGPEAVLPLTRTSGGKLGVSAEAAPVNVVVNNNTPTATVDVKESRTSNGGRTLAIEINDMVRAEMRRGGRQGGMLPRRGDEAGGWVNGCCGAGQRAVHGCQIGDLCYLT